MKKIICIFIIAISLMSMSCKREDNFEPSIDAPIDTAYVVERYPDQIEQSLLPADTVFVIEKH